MAAKKKKQDTSVIVITVVAAVLAVAAVIFLIWTFSSNGGTNEPAETSATEFVPTQELVTETEQAAYALVPANYRIYCYLTSGMSVKEEPYGNKPEDGYYTCVNDEFKTFDDWCEFIRSTYVEKTAEELISDPMGKGAVYGDDNGELGLSADFVRSEPGSIWEGELNYVCTPLSETECSLEITLYDDSGKEVEKDMTMILENGSWKLAELVY